MGKRFVFHCACGAAFFPSFKISFFFRDRWDVNEGKEEMKPDAERPMDSIGMAPHGTTCYVFSI